MKLVKDFEDGYIAGSNFFRHVLETIRLRTVEPGNLARRNFYCVL
jgi:hypothetical protein